MSEQSSSSEILHSFPVELVRIIFEAAACHSRASALSLICVSKMVHKWIAPLLYQTVVLETPHALLSFYETILVDKSDIASHTKALYLPSPPSPRVTPTFLNKFTSLQHIAIDSLSLRDAPPSRFKHYTSPRPTSITITGPISRISFRHPIFQRCTHLYLADDVPRPLALTADILPCLTHLACGYRHGTSSITAVTCLPLLLAERCADGLYTFSGVGRSIRVNSVQPKVLIVELYLSNGSPDATMFVMDRLGLGNSPMERRRRCDPRLVTRPGVPLTPQRWVDYVVSNVMWNIAEQEIRQQGK